MLNGAFSTPALDALLSIIYRRLGEGISPVRAPALVRTWFQDFRDTIGDPNIRPILTTYKAHPFRGKTPFVGQASYLLFALWRDTSDWKNYTHDTDENMSVFRSCGYWTARWRPSGSGRCFSFSPSTSAGSLNTRQRTRTMRRCSAQRRHA